MSKRRIWSDGTRVYLRDEDMMGEETIREFWVPQSGGCIREISVGRPGTLGEQVCARLSNRGVTLSAYPDTLLAVIRCEYRRRVADEKRQAACAA